MRVYLTLQGDGRDYKSGKSDIFGPMDKKEFDKQSKEVDELKARVAELKEARQSVNSQSDTQK